MTTSSLPRPSPCGLASFRLSGLGFGMDVFGPYRERSRWATLSTRGASANCGKNGPQLPEGTRHFRMFQNPLEFSKPFT